MGLIPRGGAPAAGLPGRVFAVLVFMGVWSLVWGAVGEIWQRRPLAPASQLPPGWSRQVPADGARGVPPFLLIAAEAGENLEDASVTVTDEEGRPAAGTVRVAGRLVTFTPIHVLTPGMTYRVTTEAVGRGGRALTVLRWYFQVVDLAEEYWLDLSVSERPLALRVYRGRELVRAWRASTGRPGDDTPLGVYRIQDRGRFFWSERYQEGGFFWMRLFGNYLIHSVPVDGDGRILEAEERRLGYPASHGCVRLSLEGARWLYETVPDGALVIIRP